MDTVFEILASSCNTTLVPASLSSVGYMLCWTLVPTLASAFLGKWSGYMRAYFNADSFCSAQALLGLALETNIFCNISRYERLIVQVCRKCNVCRTYLVSAEVCRDERDAPRNVLLSSQSSSLVLFILILKSSL